MVGPKRNVMDYYNKTKHFKSFTLGDFVLKKVFPNNKESGKLGVN